MAGECHCIRQVQPLESLPERAPTKTRKRRQKREKKLCIQEESSPPAEDHHPRKFMCSPVS